jgi:cyclopropane fatty-acyl-phospholipid synthase-like methyltransferase
VSVDPAVTTALRAYDGQPRGVRFHTVVRARTCPFGALEARVPSGARVLDVGCGHGLLSISLALGSPGRTVRGVDIDRDKLPYARRAANAAGLDNVTFEAVAPDWVPDGTWDAIVIADVLYLMGPEAARDLLARLAGALADGGVVLVKEIDVRPAWKYRLAQVQEQIATKVARITEGGAVEFLPPAAIGATLGAAGLHVEHVPLHRGRLHPHHLVIGRKP